MLKWPQGRVNETNIRIFWSRSRGYTSSVQIDLTSNERHLS
jgi:hypothetical protein